MPNVDDIITDVLELEGSKETNDPRDTGGRTKYGISEKHNPEAWADNKVTEEEAREIYERKYVKGPGFDKIKDFQLRAQLVDFGVNSGPAVAIMRLQEILRVPADGILGPQTLTALDTIHPEEVNTLLAIKRALMIGRIVAKNVSQARFLVGWLDRALSFIK